ncbi:hypothetical protein [Actinomadura sp. 6N118]|uniref:hypothetical protein n=1 Tax=Actinomadura sp. 6N118 TaxID=3375151 RepID=UPI00379F6729
MVPAGLIPLSSLRPRRLWYAVVVVLVLAGIANSMVNLVLLMKDGLPQRTFSAGETVTVRLQQNSQPGFYVTSQGSPADRCHALDSGGQQVAAEPASGTTSLSVNGTTWYVLSFLRLQADGNYQLTCPKTGSNASARYGIGTPPKPSAITTPALISLSTFAVAAALGITVFVRRHSYSRRHALNS